MSLTLSFMKGNVMVREYLFNSTSANYQIDNITERKEKRKGFRGFCNSKKYSCAWPVLAGCPSNRNDNGIGPCVPVAPKFHGYPCALRKSSASLRSLSLYLQRL